MCVGCGVVVDSPPMSSTGGPGRYRARGQQEELIGAVGYYTPEMAAATTTTTRMAELDNCYYQQHGCGGGGNSGDMDNNNNNNNNNKNEDGRIKEARRRAKVRDVLAVFHLDNSLTVEAVLADYKRVYCDRRPRKGFRKCEAKDRLALAFAVCRQLIRLGAPRPPTHVAAVCGVTDPGCLLKAGRMLNMSAEEMRRELHILPEAKPEDYVEVLCSSMHLPRRLACLARDLIESSRVRWLLYGRNPGHIAGGVLHSILTKLGESSPEELAIRIGDAVDCKPDCILSISRVMPAYDVNVSREEGDSFAHRYEDLLFSLGIWSLSSNTGMSYSFKMRRGRAVNAGKPSGYTAVFSRKQDRAEAAAI